MTTIRTARLTLSPIEEDDAEALLGLFNDPDVGRYLLDGEPVSRTWVFEEVFSSRDRFEQDSAGLWALRSGQDLVGVVGYRPFLDPPELQLIYALLPSAWGRGFAEEASRAAIEHGFGVLGLDEVRAATDGPNAASIRVLERLGMERWKVVAGEPYDTLFYRLPRAQWEKGSR